MSICIKPSRKGAPGSHLTVPVVGLRSKKGVNAGAEAISQPEVLCRAQRSEDGLSLVLPSSSLNE